MEFSVSSMVWSKTVLDGMLGALTTRPAGALLDTPTMYFYTDDHAADPVNDTPASFTEPTFTGYVPATFVPGAMQNIAARNGRETLSDLDNVVTAFTPPLPYVRGVFVAKADKSILYGQMKFDSPVGLAQVGDSVTGDVPLSLGFQQPA